MDRPRLCVDGFDVGDFVVPSGSKISSGRGDVVCTAK